MSNDSSNLNNPLRTLDRYEVALRNLLPAQIRATPVVQAAPAHHPELATELLGQMRRCEPEDLIDALIRLKTAMEGPTGRPDQT